jgi:hypothetical protein
MSQENQFRTWKWVARTYVAEVNPESRLAASIVWKIDFLLLQEERNVASVRFVTLQLFFAYVSVTVDVGVSRFPIGRRSWV